MNIFNFNKDSAPTEKELQELAFELLKGCGMWASSQSDKNEANVGEAVGIATQLIVGAGHDVANQMEEE